MTTFRYHHPFASPRRSPPAAARPLFAVVLELRPFPPRRAVLSRDLDDVLSRCPSRPDSRNPSPTLPVVAKLFYREWTKALDALLYFWRCILDDPREFPTPRMLSNLPIAEHKAEEVACMRELFAAHARGLLGCKAAREVERKLGTVDAEVGKVDELLGGKNKMKEFLELQERRKGLLDEREQIMERLEEFRAAVWSIVRWLENEGGVEGETGGQDVDVFGFGEGMDWGRIRHMMLRECRRLEDGLPIYGCRRKILNMLNSNQVTVLIGETGSGKSTQLVQFLADSGLSADGSILCTQPRRIAAVSLAQRVCAESYGCYNKSISSYPTYSSAHKFNSGIIFLTDSCLLQHCMNNVNLMGISYIIVDEAHERSLNTDLLLALIKKLLLSRVDLRLIIMSATADACKLSDYFYGCQMFYVKGRSFPVDIKYIPEVSMEVSWAAITRNISTNLASYVSDVVKMVSIIHQTEQNGDILAFLTAQIEVEWACENFCSPSAVVLPLHGKLSSDEQSRVFQKYPGRRKVIFCTNLAETSLTIPGVKYVVDSGMVKESRFEASSGMNVLRVCSVSQSSARQRAGRAGRTEPGKCYRLYSEADFDLMPMHQEPEIRKVHLGIAVLKILSLGVTNIEEFEFVDSPSTNAIDMAVRNLVLLGAVNSNAGALELTDMGCQLVKLGIEPRLGKLILESFDCNLGREGLVLAAVMANSSNIFCRVGNDEDKAKADCLKVPFCHYEGDLFTLLSVYKEWENGQDRNQWCWQNSVNAKSLRRCRDTVVELEHCLRQELNMIIPSYWRWNPNEPTFDGLMKKVILHCLPENVAMFSGCEHLGYEVALTGENVQLHPSCSLLIFGNRPDWVVFGDILSTSRKYLVCVTAIDREPLCAMHPTLFDLTSLENHKMQKIVIPGVRTHILKKLCGKGNLYLRSLISHIQMTCKDYRANIFVNFENGDIQVFASLKDSETASSLVNVAVECETKWLRDECMEKSLFRGVKNAPSPIALLGRGAEIKHLELEKRYLTIEISHASVRTLDDKQLLKLIDQFTPGIACFYRYDIIDSDKWGKVTFLSPKIAEVAVQKLNGMEFCGSSLKVSPVRSFEGVCKMFPSHAVKAKVCWPRKRSKGVVFVQCLPQDADLIVQDCAQLVIRGGYIRCEVSRRLDSVILSGVDKDASEAEIFDALRSVTRRKIVGDMDGIRILRGEQVDHPSRNACEDALFREINPFLSDKKISSCICHVEVTNPEPNDSMMKALIIFDGSLHLEAAKALDHLQGKTLPGCEPWQKIRCQQLFRSSISCPSRIYHVIKAELDAILKSSKLCEDTRCELVRNVNGSYRVKILANATKKIADLRRPLEALMEGKTINNPSLTSAVLELLPSKEGLDLMISTGHNTGTYISYDRYKSILKIFGCRDKVCAAEETLCQSLLTLHKNKQLEIPLRGSGLPPNLMQEVIRRFGSDLRGLKEKVPEAEFIIRSTRRQILYVQGGIEQKQKAQKIIHEVAQSLCSWSPQVQLPDTECAICLCELEDPYRLGACGHTFCRNCLLEQCESAIKSYDGFPLCCAQNGCNSAFLLMDLRFLLSGDKLEELFRASLGAFVASSAGAYRFCPSPDCPSIYKVANAGELSEPFVCGACSAVTCTKCHLEYHDFLSCDLYKKFKEHPDSSLMEWRKGKEHVKNCPICGYTIEKVDGCNHIACKCGKHICWVCLLSSDTSDECYSHLRSVHQAII